MPAIALLLSLPAQEESLFWQAVQEKLKPLQIGKADPGRFLPPPPGELEALAAFAAGALDAPLPADLERAGWRVEWIPYGPEKLRLLLEAPDARRGRGMMLARPAAVESTLVLMVPHRFFDGLTGDVARGVFFRAKASVLLENTAHRHWNRAEGAEYGPGDAAHAEATALHALARGLADGRKNLLFAQPHGFEAKDGEGALAILSDGTREPGPHVRNAAAALRASKVNVQLYGLDTRRFGATENVLGRHFRATRADDRFLHVEMTLDLRKAFKADASPLADALRAAAAP